MVRTQIQLPDELYRDAKRLAEEKEISLAEVVRRGLEGLLRTYPPFRAHGVAWKLDPPAHTDLVTDPFAELDWREKANQSTAVSAAG